MPTLRRAVYTRNRILIGFAESGRGFYFFFQLRRKFKSKHFPRLLLTVAGMESVFYEFETPKFNNMNSDKIKEIQETTAYPESVSVKQALLQVWNECAQEQVKNCSIPAVINRRELLIDFIQWYNKEYPHDAHPEWLVDDYEKSINSL